MLMLSALLIGVIAGLRAMTPPAAVSWMARSGWLNLTGTPFAFLGFTTIGVYPPRSFDPGLKSYRPSSFSLPFNLPGPNSVPYFVFSYRTKSSVDPGPFVTLS